MDDMTILLIDRQAGVGWQGNMVARRSWMRTLDEIRAWPAVEIRLVRAAPVWPVARVERLRRWWSDPRSRF